MSSIGRCNHKSHQIGTGSYKGVKSFSRCGNYDNSDEVPIDIAISD